MIRVGISGWRYPPWRGDFYPKGLPHRRELEYAAQQLTYRDQRLVLLAAATLQLCEVALGGARRLRVRGQGRPLRHPHEAAQGRRGATGELLRLRGPGPGQRAGSDPVAAAGDLRVRRDGGEGVLRAPPTDDDRGRPARHPARRQGLRGQAVVRRGGRAADALRPGAAAPQLAADEALAQLTECDVALVVADSAGKWPRFEQAVGPIVYARLHGDTELYASGYTDSALDQWAEGCAAGPRTGARPSSTSTTTSRATPRTTRAADREARARVSGVRLPTAGSPVVPP